MTETWRALIRAALVAASIATAACGSTVTPSDGAIDGGASDSSGMFDVVNSDPVLAPDSAATDAPVTGDTNMTDAPMAPCPLIEPRSNQPCPVEGAACTYGNAPQAACRDRADCRNATWQVVATDWAPTTCPSSVPAEGSACTMSFGLCSFTDGTRCNCAPCPPGGPACMPGPLRWFCIPPPSDARCPRQMPNLGVACAPEGTRCDYGGCRGGWSVECTGSIWVNQPTPCPG